MAESDEAPGPLLLDAIATADVSTLREVLKFMCESSSECVTLASQRLLIQRGELMFSPSDNEVGEDDDDEDEAVVRDNGEGGDEEEDEEDEEEESAHHPRTKRRKLNFNTAASQLISRYETCGVCSERFDVTLNGPSACRLHTGHLELNGDSSVWADDDDADPNEIIDPKTDWRVPEFPQGFTWDCCEGQADAEPCHVSRHVVKAMKGWY